MTPGSEGADSAPPRVAVIIVTYCSQDVIGGCLEALGPAARGVDLRSVVVADNHSTDATRDAAVAAWPGIEFFDTGGNLGYAAAINQAMGRIGAHDAVLVLNPDTELQPESLATLCRVLEDPSVGIAVPRMLTPTGGLAPSLRRWPGIGTAFSEAVLGGRLAARLRLGEVVKDDTKILTARDVDWATGAALAIRADVAARLGPWDETFFLYSEETEFMQRAWRQGFRVRYVPEAECRHRGGDSRVSPQLWSLLLTNKIRLYERDHTRTSSAIFRACLLLGQAARGAFGDPTGKAAARRLMRRVGHAPLASDLPNR